MLRRVFNFIKVNLSFVKDNLSVIAITPFIIGGLWQLISLASISPSYIRFFSVTQQIPDGILILFVAFTLFLSYLFFGGLIINESFGGTKNLIQLSYKNLLIRSLLSTITGIIIIVFFLKDIVFTKEKEIKVYGDLLEYIVFMGVVAIAALLIFKIPIVILTKLLESFKSRKNADYIAIFKAFLYLMIILYIVRVVFDLSIGFHNLFKFPIDLKNKDYIIKSYLSKRNSTNKDSVSIIYWNDKYIFIKDSSKIEVVKFDYMFAE